MEKRYLRKNGEILYSEISVTGVWEPDGELKYVVALAVDTTERKLAGQSLADLRKKRRTDQNAGAGARQDRPGTPRRHRLETGAIGAERRSTP